MLKLKLITIVLLTIFLEGCNTPQIRELRQRNLRLIIETDDSGRRYINEEESACFTRMYAHSKNYIGTRGNESEEDVLFCNDTIGYDSADYVELNNFMEEVRVEINKKD